jgi:hypothetical protein
VKGRLGLALACLLSGRPVLAQSAPPAPPDPDTVMVNLRADSDDVRVVRLDGDRQTPVCAPPCQTALPRVGLYRIAGEGVPPSARFVLPDAPEVTLDVHAGSATQRAVGAGIGVAGITTLVLGGLYGIGDAITEGPSSSADSRFRTVMLAADLLGLTLGLAGLIIVWTSATTVSSSTGAHF